MSRGEAVTAGIEPLQIWTSGACAGPPGYGYGGWAWLVVRGREARAAAGGERHTTEGRMGWRGVIEALKAVVDDPSPPVRIDPGDATIARLRGPADDPDADADLRLQIAAAVEARTGPVRFSAADPAARVFVEAWAAFAVDKCRAKGPFTAAIPKPNLQTFMAKKVPA